MRFAVIMGILAILLAGAFQFEFVAVRPDSGMTREDAVVCFIALAVFFALMAPMDRAAKPDA